jgi:L-lysine 2,3-aminomutase
MGLQSIALYPRQLTAISDVLREIKSLQIIRVHTAAYSVEDFWRRYDAGEFK